MAPRDATEQDATPRNATVRILSRKPICPFLDCAYARSVVLTMTMSGPQYRSSPPPHYSIPSILAIVAAAGSFMTGAALGFILAIAAIVLGVIGLLLALMPSTRGGIISLIG